MSRTIYALFVGIDAYPAPVRPLNGCVNDVTRLRDLLEERVKGSHDRFEPRLLADAEATRQGIIDAWRGHLGQARPGDVALFYYSGHGSQENAPPEFWDFEPDHLNETLVCYDSRLDGGWDLADKELAQLIGEVAGNGPHFAVVLVVATRRKDRPDRVRSESLGDGDEADRRAAGAFEAIAYSSHGVTNACCVHG